MRFCSADAPGITEHMRLPAFKYAGLDPVHVAATALSSRGGRERALNGGQMLIPSGPCQSPLVADRAIEAWYHPSIA
jgi:hypothetical protein